MRQKIIFITGAAGEVGHALVKHLAADSNNQIVTMDLRPLPDDIAGMVTQHITGNLLDKILLARISTQYEIETIYHLAALLSTASEYQPNIAHQVNVDGT